VVDLVEYLIYKYRGKKVLFELLNLFWGECYGLKPKQLRW